MTDPRDDHFSGPRSAGAPEAGRPRKPRIEVLPQGSATNPRADPAQGLDNAGSGGAGSFAPGASLGASPLAGVEQPHRVQTYPERGRSGLFRSRAWLLILLALIVIAGLLLYTYRSNERDTEYFEKQTELSADDPDLLGNAEAAADATTAERPDDPSIASGNDGAEASAAGAEPSDRSAVDADVATTDEPAERPAAASVDDRAGPEPVAVTAPRIAPQRAAAPEAEPVPVDDGQDEPEAPRAEAEDEGADPSDTVRAFYGALSAGDGTSAAQLVIPAKRRSGPLSAGALSRYYSSFRRPLRLRSVAPVDADTVRVAYDYVLADGRVCRGRAAVDVVQRYGRSLVGGIRTQGPC